MPSRIVPFLGLPGQVLRLGSGAGRPVPGGFRYSAELCFPLRRWVVLPVAESHCLFGNGSVPGGHLVVFG